jgi:tetratricopeptide (TPR) repeat protein
VGAQAMADRYAYVPLIGIFILVVWEVPELLPRSGRAPAFAGACVLILALMAATVVQQRHWKDGGAVARRAIEVNPDSLSVTTAMTTTLFRNGKGDEAIRILKEAPKPARTMNDVGQLVAGDGMLDFALRVYREAVGIDPGFAKLRNNYGVALARSGEFARAREQFSAALRLEPGYPEAQTNLHKVLAREQWDSITRAAGR